MPEVKVWDQVIYYVVIGNGPHTVVLLPGFLGTIELDFGRIFPLLNQTDFRWICWDPPGYGRSRPQDFLYDENVFVRLADLLGQFMKERGYDKYSIVGWSQGGTAGMLHASRSPENVAKLIFWGCFARLTPAANRTRELCPKLELWPESKLAERLKYFDKRYLRKICLDMVSTFRHIMERKAGKFIGDALPDVQCQTLILHGVKDQLTDDEQPKTFKNAFKNSRIHYFPEGGHDLHLQFASEFVKIVLH